MSQTPQQLYLPALSPKLGQHGHVAACAATHAAQSTQLAKPAAIKRPQNHAMKGR